MPEEEEIEDWKVEKVDPPEHLRRKWAREESASEPAFVNCPACGKANPGEGLSCLFCSRPIYPESGCLLKIVRWFQRLFSF